MGSGDAKFSDFSENVAVSDAVASKLKVVESLNSVLKDALVVVKLVTGSMNLVSE